MELSSARQVLEERKEGRGLLRCRGTKQQINDVMIIVEENFHFTLPLLLF